VTLQHFIEQFGYVAVFIGCLLEGETVLVLAGFAAHMGYLSLPAVMATAAVAGFLGDEMWFFIGRRHGERMLAQFPALLKARPYVARKVERYGIRVVFFVRFAIGLRIASPVILGASGMPPSRFTPANAAGALVWAIVMGGAGYLFGSALTAMLEHAKRYEHIAFAAIGAGVLIAVTVRHWRSSRLQARARAEAAADTLQ